MFRKRKLRKLYGVTLFYKDSENRFEFYYRQNWMGQFDIMVYDIENNNNRWFMITSPIFYTMIGLVDNAQLLRYTDNVQKAPKPKVVNDLIHNNGFKLLSHKVTKFHSDSVVAKLGEFGLESNRQQVLLLKRVAAVPEMDNMVLGMDTLELPMDGVDIFVEEIRNKFFKDVEIGIETEEEKDATN